MDLLLLIVLVLDMLNISFGFLKLLGVLWLVSSISFQFTIRRELILPHLFVICDFGFYFFLGHCDLRLGLHNLALGDLLLLLFFLKFRLGFFEVILCNRGLLSEMFGCIAILLLSSQFLQFCNFSFGFHNSWL